MTPRWELFFGGIVSLMLLPVFSQSVSAQPKPSQPVEIHITARRFEFDPRTIKLQKGQPAKLIITSADVTHGFAIDEFNINVRVEAKQTQTVEFTPDRSGHFRIYCTVYCGEDHEDMSGELVVEDTQAPENIKVSFDEQSPGVAIVESNGERFRIDTATKTVTRITEGETPAAVPHPEPKVEQPKENTQESYDYRLINVPTPKRVVRGSLNLYFTHRFTQPIRPLDDSARQLFGLDSFGVASFGVFYGITDKLYASAYRSPLCQRGLCRTIEIGLGYHWLDEKKGHSPIALSTYASVEGDENFSRNFTYNLQAMVARSVTKYVNLFFSPAVHLNANGQRRFDPQANNFFPPAAAADAFRQDKHAASFGFGVNARIRPTVSLLFEYTPRVGFKLGRVRPVLGPGFTVTGFTVDSEPEIGFGIQKDIGRHSFSLTFSNTQTTTTSRYNSSNLVLPPSKFIIGFNLYRRFFK